MTLFFIFLVDPAPFLFVSFEMKKEDSLKPYDPKKSVWVPDGEGGYDEAMIQEVKNIGNIKGQGEMRGGGQLNKGSSINPLNNLKFTLKT